MDRAHAKLVDRSLGGNERAKFLRVISLGGGGSLFEKAVSPYLSAPEHFHGVRDRSVNTRSQLCGRCLRKTDKQHFGQRLFHKSRLSKNAGENKTECFVDVEVDCATVRPLGRRR